MKELLFRSSRNSSWNVWLVGLVGGLKRIFGTLVLERLVRCSQDKEYSEEMMGILKGDFFCFLVCYLRCFVGRIVSA